MLSRVWWAGVGGLGWRPAAEGPPASPCLHSCVSPHIVLCHTFPAHTFYCAPSPPLLPSPAVSDLEVEYSEEAGSLYYFKYPVAGAWHGAGWVGMLLVQWG